MNKDLILIIIILSCAVISESAFAQSLPGQWPPFYGNYTASNQNRYPSNQAGSFNFDWQSNYVTPGYNPYANNGVPNINQNRRYHSMPGTISNMQVLPYSQLNTGFYPMPRSPLLPVYGNPMLIPAPVMNFNPWYANFSVMPYQMLPTWGY